MRKVSVPLLAAAAAVPLLIPAGALTLAARPAQAKEHLAGCPQLAPFVERLRSALLLASIQRTRGSSLAAWVVLDTNARSVLREDENAACGAFTSTLKRAVARGDTATTALDASMQLDLGYAAAMTMALTGTLPSQDLVAKRLPVPEAAVYGEKCRDIFPLSRRLTDRTKSPAARAAAVLAELTARPRCPALKDRIAQASPEDLPTVLATIALDEKDEEADPKTPVDRCPELPLVLEKLATAISRGAPLFNKGDAPGCRTLYERTARELALDLLPPEHCPVVRRTLLGALLAARDSKDAAAAAWALRRGFDEIAGAGAK